MDLDSCQQYSDWCLAYCRDKRWCVMPTKYQGNEKVGDTAGKGETFYGGRPDNDDGAKDDNFALYVGSKVPAVIVIRSAPTDKDVSEATGWELNYYGDGNFVPFDTIE